MSYTEVLLTNAARYAETFDKGDLPMLPGMGIAIVACMDARLNLYGLLGLTEGDAHVIRNAGGVVSEDVVRSLVISQRVLGTREILLIHHTDCGMLTFKDDEFKQEVERDTGLRPSWAAESFAEPTADIRQSLERIKANPFIVHKNVRGFVYEVQTGLLREVS